MDIYNVEKIIQKRIKNGEVSLNSKSIGSLTNKQINLNTIPFNFHYYLGRISHQMGKLVSPTQHMGTAREFGRLSKCY